MAVDAVTKKEFNSKIADHKAAISELDKDISAFKMAYSKDKKLKPFFHIGISAKYLNQINTYIEMNALSEQMLNIKNNSYLDNARKLIYKIYSEMEHVVTMAIDEGLNHNRELLMKIKPFNPKMRLNMYKHIHRSIDRLIKSYGENTKWKWSFPELWAKLAILGKNIIDYREIQSERDPRKEFYYDRQELLQTVKQDLLEASGKYRNKYELSTKSSNDLVYAIKLLEDLKVICSLMGDEELLKKSKAGIDAYKARLEADEDEKKGGGKKKKKVAKKKKKK